MRDLDDRKLRCLYVICEGRSLELLQPAEDRPVYRMARSCGDLSFDVLFVA